MIEGIATDYFFCAGKSYKPNDQVSLTPEQAKGVEHLIRRTIETEDLGDVELPPLEPVVLPKRKTKTA